MKVLIYSLNYSPELTGVGKYNGELATFLSGGLAHTHVLTAPPYYPEWKIHKGFENTYSTSNDVGVHVFRVPLYVPSNFSALKRLVHLISFSLSSGFRLLSLFKLKPDVVFLVQPTLFCAPATLLYCKLTGAKSLMHIQDFEVDAMFGLGMGNGFVAKVARTYERWCLKHFDIVSSISYSMLQNAEAKGVEPSRQLFFPNWADTNFVTPEVDGSSIRQAWGYAETDKVVLYSGNIGQKQGLGVVLEAASAMSDKPEVRFLLIGQGAHAAVLKQKAEKMGLKNIDFKPLQPWEDVPAILAMADVHLVVQKKGAADAVLPSKLTNILSAGGHALVTAESGTELGKIAEKYPEIYTLVEPECKNSFIEGLNSVLEMDTTKCNQVARQFAEENLNKDKVIGRFVNDLEDLIKG